MPFIKDDGDLVTIDGATWHGLKTLIENCHLYGGRNLEDASQLRQLQAHGAAIFANIRPQIEPGYVPDERWWGVKIIENGTSRWFTNERHPRPEAFSLARHYNHYSSERFGIRVRYEACAIGEDEQY